MLTVGLIADTHGLLRPEALQALQGVQHIIHAGDIGAPWILDRLRTLAPVSAVRGNNDKDTWARNLADVQVVELDGTLVYTLHDVNDLNLDPGAAGFSVVVAGHSHRPSVVQRDGVLFVNPGSAGPRRFRLPITVGFLKIDAAALSARIQALA